MIVLASFLWLNIIPVSVYATFCLSIHLSMGLWVAPTSWLLWIVLLWTWVCKYLFETLLSTLWDIVPQVGLLDPMVVLFKKVLRNCQRYCFLWWLENWFLIICFICAKILGDWTFTNRCQEVNKADLLTYIYKSSISPNKAGGLAFQFVLIVTPFRPWWLRW